MADDVGVDDDADDGARRVVVLFKATGDAPILRRNRVRVRADAAFEDVVARLSRLVRVERAFAYLGAAFTPRHDATIGDLCDGVRGAERVGREARGVLQHDARVGMSSTRASSRDARRNREA